MNNWMMKQITENLNVSPDENDIIDELTSIIGGWGETSEKQDILGLIKNYTNNKSLYEDVRTLGAVNWDKYRESGFEGGSSNYREEIVFTDKTFYSIVELLVKEKELEGWEELSGDNYMDDTSSERLKLIDPITKLFGKTLSAYAGLDSMLNKLYWAVIDNYEDIKSGEIDEFKYLTLRYPVSYQLDLSEDIEERSTYTWTVTVLGYDLDDVKGDIYNNEDGQYDPWDYNYEVDNQEVTDKDGIEIDNVREETIQESFGKFKDTTNSEGEPTEKVIDKLDVIIMERILKDYSFTEISQFEQYYWAELHELDNVLKLFGKRGQLKLAKQYIQFIWDHNNVTEFTPYLGDKLPTLKKFTFKVRWDEDVVSLKTGNIIVYDTSYAVASCEVIDNMYDYDLLDAEIVDEEFNTHSNDGMEIISSKIGDRTVYDDSTPDNEPKGDKKYNPYELC
jgi:hypothetical protein